MSELSILAQFEDPDGDGLWTFYECGKFTNSQWDRTDDNEIDYSFWEIITDDCGVKRLMYRHASQHSQPKWETDYDDNGGDAPSDLDIVIISQIDLAIAVNKMIGDI